MSPPDVNPGAGPIGQSSRPLPSDALIVVPVRNAVLFPEIVFPITVGRPATIAAAQQAVRHMIDHLVTERGFSREEAYIVCSVAADLKISEIVDAPNWIVSAFMPDSIFV